MIDRHTHDRQTDKHTHHMHQSYHHTYDDAAHFILFRLEAPPSPKERYRREAVVDREG